MNRNNNTALVATVAVISTLALVLVVITVLVLTNVIPLGASRTSTEVKQESSSQAETEKPTDVNKQSSSSGVDEAEILVENHEEPTTMYVANVKNSVYLRSEPIENESNIITTIPVGSTVRYLGNGGNGFYKISYGGYTGYSKSAYLR
ncbi:MAG: SH3 domain-containing protein [Clostridia bacterium]|nr:SH3 domain-containing protein [Clostridia bacterium]